MTRKRVAIQRQATARPSRHQSGARLVPGRSGSTAEKSSDNPDVSLQAKRCGRETTRAPGKASQNGTKLGASTAERPGRKGNPARFEQGQVAALASPNAEARTASKGFHPPCAFATFRPCVESPLCLDSTKIWRFLQPCASLNSSKPIPKVRSP